MRTILINELKEVFDDLHGDGSFANWVVAANNHLDNIRRKTPKERSDYWSKNNHWTKLYSALSKLSKNKCWYSEAPENSSEWEVEHYRPKAKALSDKKDANGKRVIIRDDGYWWLSYYWKNFRLAGSLVNKLRSDRFTKSSDVYGKGNYFPLAGGCQVAEPEDLYCEDEIPLLLDPIKARDCTLISFDKNGDVFPTYDFSDNEILNQKAVLSITYYGLDHTPIKRGRKKIWTLCDELIERTNNYLSTYPHLQDKIEKKLDECFEKLADLASKKSPYSMVVSSFVKEKSRDEKNYPWLKDALKILQ